MSFTYLLSCKFDKKSFKIVLRYLNLTRQGELQVDTTLELRSQD